MISVTAALSQSFAPDALPAAVRAALGKPLRRAAPLSQLALLGALACLPAERRNLPTILLWQSTTGPRFETITLLDEICSGNAEPMPYDFLATQPAMAAAQIQSFLPGLQTALHLPLARETMSDWSLLLSLAAIWLESGRCEQVLCAQLDHTVDAESGHWLALSGASGENALARLHLTSDVSRNALPDTPDLPARLAEWLARHDSPSLSLHSPAATRLAVEFARI